MPTTLPLPPAVTSRERHCIAITLGLPVTGAQTLSASFTVIDKDVDGNVVGTHTGGSCSLTSAELQALPSFSACYAELSAAVHAKRNAYSE